MRSRPRLRRLVACTRIRARFSLWPECLASSMPLRDVMLRHASVLEMAISQPAGETTYERMMVLLAASQCFGAVDVTRASNTPKRPYKSRGPRRVFRQSRQLAAQELTSAIFLRPTSQGATDAFAIWSEPPSGCSRAAMTPTDERFGSSFSVHQTSFFDLDGNSRSSAGFHRVRRGVYCPGPRRIPTHRARQGCVVPTIRCASGDLDALTVRCGGGRRSSCG